MNGNDNHKPLVGLIAHAAAPAAMRVEARTPADMAAQLERDATSLAMTGESFEKDRLFYETVAANLREAAAFLGKWQATVDSQRQAYEAAMAATKYATFGECAVVAREFRDVVKDDGVTVTTAWRGAAGAIYSALFVRMQGAQAAVDRTARQGGTDGAAK